MRRLFVKIQALAVNSKYCLLYCLVALSLQVPKLSLCNPLAFSSGPLPLIAIPPGAYQPAFAASPAAMMMAGQFDPYASLQTPYFLPASAYSAPWSQFEVANRRSLSGMVGGVTGGGLFKGDRSNSNGRERGNHNDEPSDEQKALDGLPLSFIEPDPPSTITERLSESFSAIGEGVKNHFRSISENFSDTMDDIRDAWRPSPANGENSGSRKRRS